MKPRITATYWAALFFLGLAIGGMSPYIGPWAAQRLGASSLLIGALFACSAAGSLVAGPLIGLVTDHLGSRRGAITGCIGVGGLSVVWLSQSGTVAGALLGMLGGSAAGIAMALLLVSATDVATAVGAAVEPSVRLAAPNHLPGPAGVERPQSLAAASPLGGPRAVARGGDGTGGQGTSGALALIRMGFSFGFAAGAPLGGALAGAAGYDALLLVDGLGLLLLAAATWWLLPAAPGRGSAPATPPAPRSLAPLALLWLAGTLVMLSDQAKTQFLPLRLTEQLHLAPSTVGFLFGAQALLELLTMPLAGRLADRVGLAPVLLTTFALPIPYLLGVSGATSTPALLALQLLQASGVAGFEGVAFVQAQRLAPGREGFATSLYGSAFSASTLLSGLLVGSIAQQAGIVGALRLSVAPVALGWVLLAAILSWDAWRAGAGGTRTPR